MQDVWTATESWPGCWVGPRQIQTGDCLWTLLQQRSDQHAGGRVFEGSFYALNGFERNTTPLDEVDRLDDGDRGNIYGLAAIHRSPDEPEGILR